MSSVASHTEEAMKKGQAAATAAGNAASSAANDISHVASKAGERIKDAGKQAVGYVQNEVNYLGDKATQVYDQALDTASSWEKSAESFVSGRPIQSVLIAAGVGVVVGYMLNRRA